MGTRQELREMPHRVAGGMERQDADEEADQALSQQNQEAGQRPEGATA